VLQGALGSLGKVRRIVKLLGMVNATPDFSEHPLVINGCSDLLVLVFGDTIGRHARSAVGMNSLPGQITVEIELIVALHDTAQTVAG
jgi:enamine deaminase RidA (YjgF/YER057c/UK114 family)